MNYKTLAPTTLARLKKTMIKINKPHNTPSIFVIMGVTGDLVAKKIIPSLWHLYQHGLLPENLSIIGFARRALLNIDFEKLVKDAVTTHTKEKTKEEDFIRFFARFSYHTGTFEDEAAFQTLAVRISDMERSWGVCANKLFYLATPPSSYKSIFKNLSSVELNVPCGGDMGWSRMLIEKPFGVNLATAKELQSLLSSYFKEEQIYRIDHYLFKEIIQGIENFRFSNNLFENTWDNTTIERIDIRIHESIGVESRGGFYDAIGALRDVGQNHLLEILATLLMEYPAGQDADVIRKNRAEIMRVLMPWTKKSVQENTFRAQYDGYREINGVGRGSTTETYFALKTELTLPRWRGVPIFMEAGKRLAEARKEIVVTLKHPKDCLLCEVGPHRPNQIVFRLEPNDEIIIHFWIKKPGFDRVLEERAFSFFMYEKEVKLQYVEEYAKVLYAAIKGEQTSFVLPNEIEAAWKFTDLIVNVWNQNATSLAEYEPGTNPRPPFLKEGANDKNNKKVRTEVQEIGIMGLGKMGGNLARRLAEKKWSVVGFNRTSDVTKKLEKEGVIGAYSIKDLTGKLRAPRVVWLMVSAGKPVDEVIFGNGGLASLLGRGDTIIDGGNSFYKDSIRRAQKLKTKGIHFLDVGVSGGPISIHLGKFAIMVGGEKEIYKKCTPIFDALSDTPSGYMGESGAGHFAKMVHNGIEYGMMQSLAEGFALLKKSSFKFRMEDVANVYNQNSIITSRLTGWLEEGFKEYGEELKDVSGTVAHTGEGQWTVETSEELGVSAPIIKGSYLFRVRSKKQPTFTGKILSMLRAVFGGHDIGPKEIKQRDKDNREAV